MSTVIFIYFAFFFEGAKTPLYKELTPTHYQAH